MNNPIRSPSEDDDAIPVLTEILTPAPIPAVDTAPPTDAAPIADLTVGGYRADPMSIDFAIEAIPVPAPVPPASAPVPPTLADTSAAELADLEERLCASVIARLQPRIEPMLEHRLNEAIRAVLDAELPGLRAKLHAALADTLGDVVARAVSNELARIHAAHPADQR